MIDGSYMVGGRSRPGAARRYLDQVVVPAAIDVAGGAEAGLERVAEAVRLRPGVAMGMAMLVGVLVGLGSGRFRLGIFARS